MTHITNHALSRAMERIPGISTEDEALITPALDDKSLDQRGAGAVLRVNQGEGFGAEGNRDLGVFLGGGFGGAAKLADGVCAIPAVHDCDGALWVTRSFGPGDGAGLVEAVGAPDQFGAVEAIIGVDQVIVHGGCSFRSSVCEFGNGGLGAGAESESRFAGLTEDIAQAFVGFDPAACVGGQLRADICEGGSVLGLRDAGEEAAEIGRADFGGPCDLLVSSIGDLGQAGQVGHVVVSVAGDISIHTESVCVNGFSVGSENNFSGHRIVVRDHAIVTVLAVGAKL